MMNTSMTKRKYDFSMRAAAERGFTLIEVMVVVVILSILAAIVVPRIMDRPDTARVTKAQADIRALESALNLYKLDNQKNPSTAEGLEALIKKPEGAPNGGGGGGGGRRPGGPGGRPGRGRGPGARG